MKTEMRLVGPDWIKPVFEHLKEIGQCIFIWKK